MRVSCACAWGRGTLLPPTLPPPPPTGSFPLATSLAFLAWGALDFAQGYARAGAARAARATLRWGSDYLLACLDEQAGTFVGQIGDPGTDHAYWGR